MSEIWPPDEARSDFEPDVQFPSFMGPGWEDVTDQQVLVNAEAPDEFPADSVDDITGLLTLGYLSARFTLFGHDFLVRTLKRGEKMDALSLAQEYDGTLAAAEAVETALLAAAVELVDGHPLTSALSADEKPIVRIRRNFIKITEWYDPVIEGVYDEYSKLVRRQALAFDALQGKSQATRLSP